MLVVNDRNGGLYKQQLNGYSFSNFHGVACNDWYQYIICVIIQGIAGNMVYKQVQE